MPSPSHTQGNTPRGTSYLVAVLLEYIRSLHEHGIKVHHCFYWCGPRPANPCRHCAAVLAPSLVVGALQRRDLDADAVSAPVLLPVRMPLPALAAHRPQACRPTKSLDTSGRKSHTWKFFAELHYPIVNDTTAMNAVGRLHQLLQYHVLDDSIYVAMQVSHWATNGLLVVTSSPVYS